jgi:hypothetical protein
LKLLLSRRLKLPQKNQLKCLSLYLLRFNLPSILHPSQTPNLKLFPKNQQQIFQLKCLKLNPPPNPHQ